MSNKEQRKAPVLRFKGFTDDWEQRKFSDIAQRISTNININLPNVTYDDIDSENETLNKGIKNLSSGKKGILFQKNDILFGKLRPYLNNIIKVDFKGIAVGDFWVLRAYEDSSFLFSLINTPQYKYIANISSGSKMPRSDWNLVSKYLFCIPSEKEQSHIGNLILKLSQLITLQQRKLDELIQIKEGIGQGLLNRHYRNLSIRFNQENSPWKQTKLGKIASFVNGRAFKQKELMNRGLYPVLRVGNFYTNNKWYYSNLNLSSDKYANKGDLLYTWSASFGPHVWKGPKVIYHYHIWKINFDPAVISKAYLYEFLKLDKKEILANSNGSTMIHITKKDMENKMITVPDMNEQIKIGKILEKLDLKIELNKNKLNNLKSVKQFLLHADCKIKLNTLEK
jgi:type I restriction enzyme S subunit